MTNSLCQNTLQLSRTWICHTFQQIQTGGESSISIPFVVGSCLTTLDVYNLAVSSAWSLCTKYLTTSTTQEHSHEQHQEQQKGTKTHTHTNKTVATITTTATRSGSLCKRSMAHVPWLHAAMAPRRAKFWRMPPIRTAPANAIRRCRMISRWMRVRNHQEQIYLRWMVLTNSNQ